MTKMKKATDGFINTLDTEQPASLKTHQQKLPKQKCKEKNIQELRDSLPLMRASQEDRREWETLVRH